ncbi:MAG: gfo/Idh/MocA family oxidoreductase, partial [Lysobacterales bacterium]
EALERGAHVLLEKPATVTLEECDALIEAADTRKLTIGVDETIVWDPLIRRARSQLLLGVLGELVHVDVHMAFDLQRGGRLDRILKTPACWERQLPGGPLEDLLPHPLSVVRALTGGLALEHWRSTCTGRLPAEFIDELRLSLAADRTTASVSISLSARPDDFLVTLHGTRASVRIDIQNMLYDCLAPLPGPRAASRGMRVVRSGLRALGQTARNALLIATGQSPTPASPIHLIVAHHAALAKGAPPPCPLAAARTDIAAARAIWPAEHSAAAAASSGRQPATSAASRRERRSTERECAA